MLLASCAFTTNGPTQDVMVYTRGGVIQNTDCTLVNEEGAWEGRSNTSIPIHRDGNDMSVNCSNDVEKGIGYVKPSYSGGALAIDILIDFCIFTCLIDGLTNSWYNYPSVIYVDMTPKSQSQLLTRLDSTNLSKFEIGFYSDFKKICKIAKNVCEKRQHISHRDKFSMGRLADYVSNVYQTPPRKYKDKYLFDFDDGSYIEMQMEYNGYRDRDFIMVYVR